jgi:hypothetical protein
MDVWFDSGSSWAGVLGGDEALNYPADLYLEVRTAKAVPISMSPNAAETPAQPGMVGKVTG